MADNEATFADLEERIQKTLKVLESVSPTSMDGKEENEVVMGERKFTVAKYIVQFAVPSKFPFSFLRKSSQERS